MTAWRRHWKIPVALALLMAALVLLGGDYRVIAYVGQGGDTSGYTPTVDYGGSIDLFDRSVIHTIELDIDEDDIDSMVTNYLDTGDKIFVSADITIDGITIEDVGARLKGFSTLRTAVGAGLPGAETDFDGLPFLVRLDEFRSGTSYQGVTEIALRTEGPTEDDTVLEEMVSVIVLEKIGLEAPRVAYIAFSLNGGAETLRIVADNPSDEYVERVEGGSGGVLYKAQSAGNFRYLGHDPTAYNGIFEQDSAINELDMSPLMDFLEFVETSSDEVFAAELDDRLDVGSFIDYLVIHNLMVNVDSLAGTNHNFYLLYSLSDERMTVLSWDLNESLGGFWHTSGPSWALLPDWSNTNSNTMGPPMGDGIPGGAPGGPPPDAPQGVTRPGVPQDGRRPVPLEGAFPQGGLPQGQVPPGGDAGDPPTRGQFGPGGENLLVSRFMAVDGFAAAYDTRYSELTAELFGDGLFESSLEDAAELLVKAIERGLLTDAEVRRGVAERLEWIGSREVFLQELGFG